VSGRFVRFVFLNEPFLTSHFAIYFSILLSFTLLYKKKFVNGTDVLDLPYAGFGLVFGTWPVVFNQLPGGIHWVRLIFFNLWLLGIDSAFAFLEAFISVLSDTGTYKIQFIQSTVFPMVVLVCLC
jgi:SNF family Na+-dependent transporter